MHATCIKFSDKMTHCMGCNATANTACEWARARRSAEFPGPAATPRSPAARFAAFGNAGDPVCLAACSALARAHHVASGWLSPAQLAWLCCSPLSAPLIVHGVIPWLCSLCHHQRIRPNVCVGVEHWTEGLELAAAVLVESVNPGRPGFYSKRGS